ncbi:MAG: pyruvate kinase alpha/beta domain-containing protein [Candidatus Zipacnadales bacterium]
MEKTIHYWEQPGPINTVPTLEASMARAADLGITQVVVATSTGTTTLRAAQIFGPTTQVIGVTLQRGLWEKYAGTDRRIVQEAETLGVKFLTCPHTLMGSVDSALRDRFGGVPPQQLIAHVYYTFGQGMKVAVECMMMAADAGLLDMNAEVISIAGTGGGADVAIVTKPVFSHQFFSLKIREIIAMPR